MLVTWVVPMACEGCGKRLELVDDESREIAAGLA
jgi:hypothetical protein